MSREIPRIGREELRAKMENGEEFVLVDALAPMSYARSHLPGAINLPLEWVDERAPRRIPEPDTEIVVYCIDAACTTGVRAISAGNYGGKLGPYHFHLRQIMNATPA